MPHILSGRKAHAHLLGFDVCPVRLDVRQRPPPHRDALRPEADRRAREIDSGKPDASAVLREILDAWLARSRHKLA